MSEIHLMRIENGEAVRICLTYNICVGEKNFKKYIKGALRSGAHAFNLSTWELEAGRSL